MSGGWNFNDDAQSHELVSDEQKYSSMSFKDMPVPLLDALLSRLVEAGHWQSQVKTIKEELKTRVPVKVITSVTVKGNI